MKFVKFLRIPFVKNICERLFLIECMSLILLDEVSHYTNTYDKSERNIGSFITVAFSVGHFECNF